MEEGEKMVALKKAYADIILNTAKEAAFRIMVSERKALCFQQELFSSKDEALNMFLRFKQMMDSQIAEVENASLSQQRRIKELEAQLHEAEDIVTDLRAQLEGVQDDLEKMKNTHVNPLDEQIKGNIASHEDASFPKVMPSNERNIEENLCFVSETATSQTEHLGDFPAENYYDGNPDLASIIMRSKEPDLYRNGCTQRIRALERNLLSGQLPLLAQTDDQCSNIKNESSIRAEVTCTMDSSKDGDMGSLQEKPTDNSCEKGQTVNCFRRFPSRKRKARYKKAKLTLCGDQVMQACESSTGEDPSKLIEEDVKENPDSHLAPVPSFNTTDEDPRSGCMDGIGSDAEVIKTSSVQNAADEDTLTRRDSELADSSGVPICKLDLKTVDVPQMTSDSKDDKACQITNGSPTQAVNDRVLKYTFMRKRKKEMLSCLDENASLEKNTTKWRTGEKQGSAQEQKKSSLIVESSRDSRRLVLVARQLISLSEKKWWQ